MYRDISNLCQMKIFDKKISVLLAVNNGAAFIEEAIKSVLSQTYINWELLIVDNASTDRTKEISQNFVALDERINYYYVKEKGKTNAYNLGFIHSCGDYICFFAADDILSADSLEKRLAGAEKNHLGCSTCLLKTFSEDPVHDNVIFPKNQALPNFSGGSIFFSRELGKILFPIPSVLPNEDTWTSLHLRAFGNNTHLSEVLYHYRIHGSNSYGYSLSFHEKRKKFLERMHGYELFYERYKGFNYFVDTYVKNFVQGINLVKEKNIMSLALHSRLSIREKAIFIFYSSIILYKLRYKYFKFFSGLIN